MPSSWMVPLQHALQLRLELIRVPVQISLVLAVRLLVDELASLRRKREMLELRSLGLYYLEKEIVDRQSR